MIRSKGKLAIVAFVAGAAACTSLPDTHGYTVATLALKQNAVAAGDVMHSELARTADQFPEGPDRNALKAKVEEFDTAWQVTVASLAAMGEYAQAVENLTKAGNNGAQSAHELSDKVLSLAGTVGFVPGAAAAGILADTFSSVYREVANLLAARSLEASLAAADPILQGIAGKVSTQVGQAEQTFNALISQQAGQVDIAFTDVHDIDAALGRAEDDATRSAASGNSGGALQANLTRLRDARALIAPRVAEYQAARDAVAARERAGRNLFLATRTALKNWADSHSLLVTAVRERRPVSFQSLLAAGEDVRSLIQRWRDL
jgi:hypothetical protein